jgi:hypothetical protein
MVQSHHRLTTKHCIVALPSLQCQLCGRIELLWADSILEMRLLDSLVGS